MLWGGIEGDARSFDYRSYKIVSNMVCQRNEEDVEDAPAIGRMSHQEEDLLREALNIYWQQNLPTNGMYQDAFSLTRQELEEVVISQWKRESRVRAELHGGPDLPEKFMEAVRKPSHYPSKLAATYSC